MSVKSAVDDTVVLAGAPDIPGLHFRRYRGESDLEGMVAVFEASREVDEFDWLMTVEDLRIDFAHPHNYDPYRDVLIAAVDGEIIAYSRVSWEQELEGDWTYGTLGLMAPAWRRKGVGTAMLRHDERRLREIARGHPPDVPKYYQRGAYTTEVGLVAMLENEGYSIVRHGYQMRRSMELPLSAAPMPEGLEVRTVREEDVRTVMEALEEAFRDHWGWRPITEDEFKAWREHPTFDPALWKVAWEGDQVAGMVLNFLDAAENKVYGRKRGYTETICVRRPWRRRGLARSLIAQSIRMFKEMGMEETALGVDTENPNGALRLYEGVGYQVAKHHTTYRKAMI